MTYRCTQDLFTQEEFDRHRHLFYALPSEWGPGTSRPPLDSLWRTGRAGAVSILPILGLYANAGFASALRFPVEKLARLTRLDPGTVRKGADALVLLGLAERRVSRWMGKSVTQWKLMSSMSAGFGQQRLDPHYFHFQAKVFFGGNWGMPTPCQRAVYVGAATQARLFKGDPGNNVLLKCNLGFFDYEDLRLAYLQAGGPVPGVRLALLSYSELSDITGMNKSAVIEAVSGLKHPSIWRGSRNDPLGLEHMPLSVYPTEDGGCLIYHFRDHAAPWPWQHLNLAA